ncbi:MAG: hypothetical protein A2286_06620 [Gammaproteobacteria bacterium RIFOXYA12_FULL_61_12]|nr:MAG: hypothetical protein A2514_10610 [Gammaproteobacteria bacterium RIFOXYD12_FULL_61_37]OGT91232.1 MAG: hypothetical protein A2286_06620 [Gammaproteobacteria bacterium RIFOXYA12_FULL_61_12]
MPTIWSGFIISGRRTLLRPHALIALLILLFAGPCRAAVMSGWVVWVVDGDTLHLMDEAGERHRIRLSGINAPEKDKPFAQGARDQLVSLVQGKRVSVYWDKVDKYERIVGKVVSEGRDINLALIRTGYALWYRRFAQEQNPVDQMLYENAEQAAKREGAGLWSGQRR